MAVSALLLAVGPLVGPWTADGAVHAEPAPVVSADVGIVGVAGAPTSHSLPRPRPATLVLAGVAFPVELGPGPRLRAARRARTWAALPAPLASLETFRYRVSFGPLGGLADVELQVGGERIEQGRRIVELRGRGDGTLLGAGKIGRTVASRFDVGQQGARGWVMERRGSKRISLTEVEQPAAGRVAMRRQVRDRGADESAAERSQDALTFDDWALDPVSLLMRLRLEQARPGQATVHRVFDGGKLWRVTVQHGATAQIPERPQGLRGHRLDGHAEPIFYDGSPDLDGDREAHRFVLWLADDSQRTPVRIEIPFGPTAAVADLVSVERQARPPLAPPSAPVWTRHLATPGLVMPVR